jgi:hypothetical protein
MKQLLHIFSFAILFVIGMSASLQASSIERTKSVVAISGFSGFGNGDIKPNQNRLGVTEIYPNPAHNVVNADYTFPANVKSAKVVIFNILGTKIEEQELNRTDKQVSINTTDYAGGVYIFTISVDGVSEFSKRMIVKH